MTIIQATRLTQSDGGSMDKEYQVHLIETDGGFHVTGYNGKRGGTLTARPQTKTPVPREEADKMFTKLLNSKLKDGYVMEGSSAIQAHQVVTKEKRAIQIELLKEVSDEAELERLFKDDNYFVQEKKDGRRRTLEKTATEVLGGNKKCEVVPLPLEVVEAVAKHKEITLDAELIGDTLYAFDLLSLKGKDLRNNTAEERVAALEKLSFGKNIVVVETAFGEKDKRALASKIQKENGEGYVFKKKDAAYTIGRQGNAKKFKLCKTATIRVAKITKGKRSIQMTMTDGVTETKVGAVTIPVNKEIPSVGDFCEVRYLYAYKGGSLFQPVFLGKRDDADETDIGIAQLIYKAE